MLNYFIAFAAVAVFPTALAALGGHLATLAISDDKKRRQTLTVVWVLAALGVAFAAAQQLESYRSDKEHDGKIVALQGTEKTLQDTLNTSVQKQEYMRGQLDSISVMIAKVGEKSSDPVVGQLAGAITKLADNSRQVEPSKNVSLTLLYDNKPLNGQIIQATQVTQGEYKTLTLSKLQIRLNGNASAMVAARLYLSVSAHQSGLWQEFASDEPQYPTALYQGTQQPVSPQETWNAGIMSIASKDPFVSPISARLKVFYGADKPAEADFTIRLQQ